MTPKEQEQFEKDREAFLEDLIKLGDKINEEYAFHEKLIISEGQQYE